MTEITELEEEWFTLEDIEISETDDLLYCISVDSPEKQFLIGEINAPTHNTDEAKEEDNLKSEAQMIIGLIARLGRASGVHLVLATQRPDAKLIPGETKANLGVRINCGYTDSTASMMILDSGEGTRVKSYPRGRLYLSIYNKGDHGQGFFAQSSWIDEWLKSKGKNLDGTPIPGFRPPEEIEPPSEMEEVGESESIEVPESSAAEQYAEVSDEGLSEGFSEAAESEEIDPTDFIDEFLTEEGEAKEVDSGDFGYEEIETEESEDDPMGMGLGPLNLGEGQSAKDKFHRPEEDWDSDWDALIEENQ